VGTGVDLHVHIVPAVLHRIVRLIRADPADEGCLSCTRP
jgi:hypothetical protein